VTLSHPLSNLTVKNKFMNRIKLLILLLTILSVVPSAVFGRFRPHPETASVYQFSVPVGNRIAYLWLPEKCQYVRGLIISYENMLERNWLESPVVRKAATQENLGIIWLADGKPTNITWETKPDAIESLQQMFNDLAKEAGYSEIENAPLIVMGHSWNGRLAWTYPSANPDRVIASMPIRTYPMPDTLAFSGIPLCYIVGETTELPQFNDGRPGDRDFYWPIVRQTAVALRTNNENNLIGVATNPGGNHTDWNENQSELVALFIRKACQYRLSGQKPANGKVTLKTISKESGWLTDTDGMEPDRIEPAPYSSYKGDAKKAYWFFDEEMARAVVKFCGDRKKREKQMPTFVQDGKILTVKKSGYVEIPFKPENDGITFGVDGGFLAEVPEGLIDAGAKLNHAPANFSFSVNSGSAYQTSKNTFQIQFDRQAFRTPLIQVIQEGNKQFRRALQPGKLNILAKNKDGKPQQITFPEIADQKFGIKQLKLNATSDAGMQVRYYIKAGPAVVKGDKLVFTTLPPRTKFPVKVTVVAWQYGRTVEPKVQTAEPIERSFWIIK
jgi:hypothetical protein